MRKWRDVKQKIFAIQIFVLFFDGTPAGSSCLIESGTWVPNPNLARFGHQKCYSNITSQQSITAGKNTSKRSVLTVRIDG